jgi:tetratricopeptide (TPR) repeat protein
VALIYNSKPLTLKFILMKNIKRLLALPAFMLLMLAYHSCTDKFLEVNPQNDITDANFWKNEKDFEAGVNAAYFALQWDGASFPWYALANMPTGDLKPNENDEHFNLEKLNFQAINGQFASAWRACYTIISRTNLVLKQLETTTVNLNTDLKTRLTGESKFLRGFAYFMLARGWGDVPLIVDVQTASSPKDIAKTPVAQIWQQVIKDLSEASEVLPVMYDEANTGRATKGAALGYLAFTYMYTKEWQKAAEATEALLALNRYDLVPEYKQVFALENENNEESVFEVQYRDSQLGWGASRNGHYLSQHLAPRGIGEQYAPYGGWGNQLPTQQAINAFEPGDKRRPAQILLPGETYVGFTMESKWTTTGFAYTKWWLGPSKNDHVAQNLPQLRFAEVLLNYAEILNELGRTPEAYIHINRVRERAGLPPKEAGNKEKAMDDIMQERRVEILIEYNMWYHLTRTGRAADFVQKEYGRTLAPHMYLFPIPQSELDANKALEQNIGY